MGDLAPGNKVSGVLPSEHLKGDLDNVLRSGRRLQPQAISEMLFYSEYTINNELCKVSSVLKGQFPYLEWLRLKKHNSKEILQLAKQLYIL